MQARLVLDCGYSAPRSSALYVITLEQMVNEDWRANADRVWVSHFSTMSRNDAHPHPQISPDGGHLLWQSDSDRDDLGSIPGPRGGERKVDLYVSALGATAAQPLVGPGGDTRRRAAPARAGSRQMLNGRALPADDTRRDAQGALLEEGAVRISR
jgi:hypothetical protein